MYWDYLLSSKGHSQKQWVKITGRQIPEGRNLSRGGLVNREDSPSLKVFKQWLDGFI
jgi:hypothetical protein